MKIEHWALNVQDPLAATDWYCENFGMRVVRKGEPPSTVRFLADDNGVKFEIYHNASAPVQHRTTPPSVSQALTP